MFLRVSPSTGPFPHTPPTPPPLSYILFSPSFSLFFLGRSGFPTGQAFSLRDEAAIPGEFLLSHLPGLRRRALLQAVCSGDGFVKIEGYVLRERIASTTVVLTEHSAGFSRKFPLTNSVKRQSRGPQFGI